MTDPSPDLRPCFIVSTGRCGSKMLARVLALHPQLGAFHEPKPWLNTEAYLRWSGRKDPEYAHARLEQKRDDLIEQVDANGLRYIESSHFLSHVIPDLRDRYDARFIHLYRDGRDFVRSGLERDWYPVGAFARTRGTIRRMTGLKVGDSFADHRLDPPSSEARSKRPRGSGGRLTARSCGTWSASRTRITRRFGLRPSEWTPSGRCFSSSNILPTVDSSGRWRNLERVSRTGRRKGRLPLRKPGARSALSGSRISLAT